MYRYTKPIISLSRQNILELYVRIILYRLLNTEVVLILLYVFHIQDVDCTFQKWLEI